MAVLHESSAGAPRRMTSYIFIKLFQNTVLGLFLSLLVRHLAVRIVIMPPQNRGS
jgi:hypothetical protein